MFQTTVLRGKYCDCLFSFDDYRVLPQVGVSVGDISNILDPS